MRRFHTLVTLVEQPSYLPRVAAVRDERGHVDTSADRSQRIESLSVRPGYLRVVTIEARCDATRLTLDVERCLTEVRDVLVGQLDPRVI